MKPENTRSESQQKDEIKIATDAASHADHVIKTLNHGRHVASAVPAVFGSLEDADRVFDAVRDWRVGLPPQWYPTHSNAYHIGVTGESFTEVSCLGMPSVIGHLKPENNRYKNPSGPASRSASRRTRRIAWLID